MFLRPAERQLRVELHSSNSILSMSQLGQKRHCRVIGTCPLHALAEPESIKIDRAGEHALTPRGVRRAWRRAR